MYACDGDVYTVYHMVWVRTTHRAHFSSSWNEDLGKGGLFEINLMV